MSVKVMTHVLENSRHSGNELLTLIVLADHADENGICWPSMERVGKLIRADERTARRCVKRLEESGELRVSRQRGRGKVNRYQIPIQATMELFEGKGGNLSGDNLPPKENRTKRAVKPDTAVSAEPSKPKSLKPSRAASQPGPVAECFRRYSKGMKAKTGAEYPSNARANGQLAQVVKRVGAEAAPAVVEYFLASSDPYYAKTGWRLDSLVRDCERLYMAMKGRGGAPADEPTVAEVEALCADDRTIKLQDYDIDEPMRVARKAGQEYTKLLRHKSAHSIAVKIGAQRSIFRLEELWA